MKSFSIWLAVGGVLCGALTDPVCAQTATGLPADRDTPGESARLLEEVRRQVAQGRGQLDANQIESVETLRTASQKALEALVAFMGEGVLTAPPEEIPTSGFHAAAARQAADAHYWWGRAADQFGRRDEALTALARASRFAGEMRGGSNFLARDALLALGGNLREGLPLLAPDDTLETISEIAHGKLWQPLRFSTDFSNVQFEPRAPDDAANAGEFKREFLVTTGRIYPPVPTSTVDVSAALARVPPLYRQIPADSRPEVLNLDRMVLGYEKETAGPNKGLWRQAVRVFYASTFLTQDQRDDSARAEALCAQFLKVRALMQMTLGLQNPYVRDGVTTLWLSEVSALWPKDDDDPRVREALGPQMPRVNVRMPGQPESNAIETTPVTYPWAAAGQLDSSPGEIMYFKMAYPREEAEWLRQSLHEYGHVLLPPIGGFKPPLEPYGNGLVGETLGMLWAASDPAAWTLPDGLSVKPNNQAALPATLREHVQSNALLAIKAWLAKGPVSPLRRDGSVAGLQYLQGFATYIERVYGAPILGAASKPLLEKTVASTDPLARLTLLNTDSLMTSFPTALRDPMGGSVVGTEVRVLVGEAEKTKKTLPIWLGGALELPALSVDDLIARAPVKLKNGERVAGWLYVPAGASTLRVETQSNLRLGTALQAEGNGKFAAVSPLQPDANNATAFDVKARSGWQRFNFIAKADLTILAAQFEK